jgi:hypothetical protein
LGRKFFCFVGDLHSKHLRSADGIWLVTREGGTSGLQVCDRLLLDGDGCAAE